jgi:NADH dehydrogenase FAD-containing subunit
VAGEMNDFLRESVRYYDRIDLQDIGVTVLEHGSRILPPMPEALSAFAERKMTTQGIRIRKGVAVEAVSRDGVHLVAANSSRRAPSYPPSATPRMHSFNKPIYRSNAVGSRC